MNAAGHPSFAPQARAPVRGIRRLLPAALTTIALAAGCASALKPLDRSSSLSGVDPSRVDPTAATRLAQQAERSFARRPDRAAVQEAEKLWLEAAVAAPTSATAIIGAVRAQAWLANHETDSARRQHIAETAVSTAQWCGAREPDSAACHYWLALALGLQADTRHSTAIDGLRLMVQQLRLAIDKEPGLERAGPHRILARVLANAPGWPTGPGDADAGLEQARLAVQLYPDFPPNLLVLADAYRQVDDFEASREKYTEAHELAVGWQQNGNPDAVDWIREALESLAELAARG